MSERTRYSDIEAELDEDVHSGLSGIQPTVMIRAIDGAAKGKCDRQSRSFRSATHIVKFWDLSKYPELAANEHFCLSVAKAMGLTVPNFFSALGQWCSQSDRSP